MKAKRVVWFWAAALFAALLALAVTAGAAETDAAPVAAPGSPWWVELLAASGAVVAGVLAWVGRLVAARLKLNQAQAEMMDALAAGVAKVYDDYVRAWKAAQGGKLTPDQKKMAKETAIANALALAKGPAKDLMLSYGKEHLAAWIEAIVTKAKGGTNDQLAAGGK